MTLTSPLSTVTYQGNGLATSFPFTFPILNSAHLVVILTDTTQTPMLTTTISGSQYTASGIGSTGGGSIILPTPLAVGMSLTIQRIVPYAQTTSIVNQGGFYPDVLESALDYLTMEVQQLAEQSSRTVLVPVGSAMDPSSYLTTVQTAASSAGTMAANAASAAQASAATASTALGALGSAQISALTASGAASTALAALASAQASALSAANAATTAIAAMSSAQISALTASGAASTALAALSSAQASALSASSFSASAASAASTATNAATNAAILVSTQLSAYMTTTLSVLSSAQASALTASSAASTAVAALSSAQASALSASAYANTCLAALASAQNGAIGTTQIAGLNMSSMVGLTSTQLNGLNMSHMVGLTTTQVGVIPSTQMGALSSTQLNGLSAAGMTGISAVEVPVRQTVLSGDSGFLTTGSGLTPAFTATKPLVMTFANGFGSSGAVDLVTALSAGGAMAAVPASSTSYLYATYVNGTSVTWGYSLIAPQYGPSFDNTGYGLYHLSAGYTDDYGGSALANTGGSLTAVTHTGFSANAWKTAGSSTYLTFPTLPKVSGPWTLQFWVDVAALGTNQGLWFMGASSSGPANSGYPNGLLINSSNKTSLSLSSGAGSWDICQNTTGSLTWTTGWHFVELSWDGSTYRVFVDGTLDISVTSSSAAYSNPAATAVAFLGASDLPGTGIVWPATGTYFSEVQLSVYARHTVNYSAPSAPATADSGDWFDTVAYQMKAITGAGPTYTAYASPRVYVGEAVAGASTLSSVAAYAFQGAYTAAWTAGLPGTSANISVTHNLGTNRYDAYLDFKCLTADYTWLAGDILTGVVNSASGGAGGTALAKRRNASVFGTGSGYWYINAPGGGTANLTLANWAYSQRFKRSF